MRKFRSIISAMPMRRLLRGPHIVLKRLSQSHLGEYGALLKRNQAWLDPWFPPLPDNLGQKDLEAGIRLSHREARSGMRLDLGIFTISDGTMVGKISLHGIQWGVLRSAGLAYWIDEASARHGYTREATALLAAFAFREIHLHRLWASTRKENIPSQNLLQSLGFQCEGLHRKEVFLDGKWRDQYYFTLMEREFSLHSKVWEENHWLEP